MIKCINFPDFFLRGVLKYHKICYFLNNIFEKCCNSESLIGKKIQTKNPRVIQNITIYKKYSKMDIEHIDVEDLKNY